MTIVRETGRPIVEVARKLGIGAGMLGNWVHKDRVDRGDESDRAKVDVAYVRRLERELAEVRMERDVLRAVRGPVGERGVAVSVAHSVAAQRTDHGIAHATSCRALGVSASWFYKWPDRDRRHASSAATPSTPR